MPVSTPADTFPRPHRHSKPWFIWRKKPEATVAVYRRWAVGEADPRVVDGWGGSAVKSVEARIQVEPGLAIVCALTPAELEQCVALGRRVAKRITR